MAVNFLSLQYVHSHAVEAYNVTVQKASGEPATESTNLLKGQSVTLFLCYSAYTFRISALNKAGLSPAARLDVDAMEDHSGQSSRIFIRDTEICMTIHLMHEPALTLHESWCLSISNLT